MKILFNSHGGLGDELCCSPTYRKLSQEGHEVYVRALYPDLFYNSPYIKTSVHKDTTLSGFPVFDKVIDMLWFNEVGWGLDMHLVDFYAKQAGVEIEDRTLDIFPTEENDEFADKMLTGLPRPIIMYNTYHGWYARGALDIATIRAIDVLPGSLVRIGTSPPWEGIGYNLVGYTGDIQNTAALLKKADLYVGNDSGLAHVAAAVGCRAVVLYGSTNPELRKHEGQYPVWNKRCYGCYNGVGGPPAPEIVQDKCRRGTFECVRYNKTDDVLRVVNTVVMCQKLVEIIKVS